MGNSDLLKYLIRYYIREIEFLKIKGFINIINLKRSIFKYVDLLLLNFFKKILKNQNFFDFKVYI